MNYLTIITSILGFFQKVFTFFSKMYLEKGYWVDKNNNKWRSDIFTRKVAIKYSNTLIDCKECIDCAFCINCSACVNCYYCLGLIKENNRNYKEY